MMASGFEAAAGLLGADVEPYQVGIAVPKLEPAVEAFQRATGCGPFAVYLYDRTELIRESHLRGTDSPYAARIAIGGGEPQIEYIEPQPGDASIVSEHVASRGFGLHHLGFRVVDFDDAIERMEGGGFGVVQRLSGWGLDGDGAAVFFDTLETLGFWVEVVDPAARRRPAHGQIPAAVGG
jgi:methylmalonyl-CoA/ethylmalonyl-CoA epimerase